MSRHLWRILLMTLCGCPIVVVIALGLQRIVVATGLVTGGSFVRGVLLHEAPFVFSVFPLAVAIGALGYVGAMVAMRGRAGMPERPRLVTWLILAVFVLPVGLFGMQLGLAMLRS
jgi:hypothetical protein